MRDETIPYIAERLPFHGDIRDRSA